MSEMGSTATGSSASASISNGPSMTAQSQSTPSTTPNAGRGSGTGLNQNTSPNPNASGKQLTEGQAASETQPQASPEPRRLGEQDLDALVTVKINGKTEEIPLKEVIKLQQLEKASHEKMRQAAEIQRRAQELMQLDIDKFAQMKGMDLDALAEERLAKKYELMQMTPEQRRLHELEQRETQRQISAKQQAQLIINEIKNYTTELPPGIENASPEQLHAYLEHTKQVATMVEQNLERDFLEAWKETGMPKSKYFGSVMAFHMMNSKNPDGTPLQAAQAASKVKQEFVGNVREVFGHMDAKAIHDLLGKDLMTKLREYDVQRVTANQAASNAHQRSPGLEPASNQKKYVNQIEWRRSMGLD